MKKCLTFQNRYFSDCPKITFIFDQRGGQRVSVICIVLVSGSWLFAAVALIVTLFHKITWLTYLYYFSYIKIGVTLIKYIPQVRFAVLLPHRKTCIPPQRNFCLSQNLSSRPVVQECSPYEFLLSGTNCQIASDIQPPLKLLNQESKH